MQGCLVLIMLPFIIPIVIAAIFILRIFLKGKAEGWKGTVLDKAHNTKRDDDDKRDEHFYSLKVKMTDGKERNIAVSSEFWASCKNGDVIEKPKGAIFPKKVT
jgi:hypothetical protein